MLSQLALIALSSVSLAFLALAIRLFRSAWGTERRAELFVGVFFAAIGAEVLAYGFTDREAGIGIALSVAVSSCAMLAFVRTVFRPNDRWALILSLVLGASISAVYIVPHLLGGPTPAIRILWSISRSTALLWSFFECARYYGLMRRRVALGLAEPVVANRFLLWSLWTAGTAMLPLSGLGLRLLALTGLVSDFTTTREPTAGAFIFAGMLFMSLSVAAISLALSFFPPTVYKNWITNRAAARQGA